MTNSRHKKDNLKSVPSFLDEVENGNKDLRAELSELQVQYVDSINELEKTRQELRFLISQICNATFLGVS